MRLQNAPSDDMSVRSRLAAIRTGASLEAVGFWLAIMLPVPTVLVLASGVSTQLELAAIGGLLAANLLAFYFGHDYATDQP